MDVLTFILEIIIGLIALGWWTITALFMVYMLVLLGALLVGSIIRLYNWLLNK